MSRSPSGNGSGFRRTALIAENTALFAPIPNARVTMTVTVNARVFASVRTAIRKMFMILRRWEIHQEGWHGRDNSHGLHGINGWEYNSGIQRRQGMAFDLNVNGTRR